MTGNTLKDLEFEMLARYALRVIKEDITLSAEEFTLLVKKDWPLSHEFRTYRMAARDAMNGLTAEKAYAVAYASDGEERLYDKSRAVARGKAERSFDVV